MKKKVKRTPAAELLTAATMDLFRLNNLLLTEGDHLVAELGLTSARWQILGAIVRAPQPQPVAWLARNLGANRQNVQRIVNDLHKQGLVQFEANPHHRRAQWVVLTESGKDAYTRAMESQAPWANRVTEGISPQDLETLQRTVSALKANLENDQGSPRPAA